MITNFKARLVEIPKIKKEKSEEFVELGKFTLNRRYRVYTIYSEKTFTDFLVADDDGIFRWINMAAFRE